MPSVTVRVTRRFNASPERVFDAWLDAPSASKWLFATPTGTMVRAEVDPRVGGRYVFTDRRDGEDVEHTGEYLELERPRRLVFTLAVPKYSQTEDRLTIDIAPVAEGGCELTLAHENLPAQHAASAEQGWGAVLAGLAKAVE
jgi:uncharacterized protein YndB with AHSA1/START domain